MAFGDMKEAFYDRKNGLVFSWRSNKRNLNSNVLAFFATAAVVFFLFYATRISLGEKAQEDIVDAPIIILNETEGLPDALRFRLLEESPLFDGLSQIVRGDNMFIAKHRLNDLLRLDREYRSELIALPEREKELNLEILRRSIPLSLDQKPRDILDYEILAAEDTKSVAILDVKNEFLLDRLPEHFLQFELSDAVSFQGRSFTYSISVDADGRVRNALPVSIKGPKGQLNGELLNYLRGLRFREVGENTLEWSLILIREERRPRS